MKPLTASPGAAAPARFAELPIGTPHDRLAKLAARRAFVELKLGFLQAAATLDDDAEGQWLRCQVRQADAPEQLWLLRGAVFAALRGPGGFVDSTRAALRRTLDTAFPAFNSF